MRSLPPKLCGALFGALILVSTLVTPSLVASEQSTVLPTPYRADYRILKGSKTIGEGVRSLTLTADGGYEMYARSKIRYLVYKDKREERSRFNMSGNRITPVSYRYRQDTTLQDVDVDLNFTDSQVRGVENGESLFHPWEQGLLDPLSYQQQMAQDLAKGKREFTYRFVQSDKIKEYHFRVMGEETIKTPYGQINALRVDRIRSSKKRETRFWLWPEQDFMLVRLLQINSGKPFLELQLDKLSMK